MQDKHCTKCKQTKPLDDFPKDSRRVDGLNSWCRACANAAARSYYAANTEKAKANVATCQARRRAECPEQFLADARRRRNAWRKRNPEKYAAHKRKVHLRTSFGISPERYDEAFRQQGGVCAVCKREPKGKRLAVDHDHRTGMLRGLLCTDCNHAIGKLGDCAAGLERALNYLNHYPSLLRPYVEVAS